MTLNQVAMEGTNMDYLVMTITPNNKIYLPGNNRLRVFDLDNNIASSISFTGKGLYGYPNVDIAQCHRPVNYGLAYNKSTSDLTYFLLGNWQVLTEVCGNTGNVSMGRINPSTFALMSSSTQPANTVSQSWTMLGAFKTGMDGRMYTTYLKGGRFAVLNEATNTFDNILAIGQGNCIDGTLAKDCKASPQDIFVAQNGTIYFIDAGRIRTILPDKTVKTLYGAWGADGDDGSPLAARLSDANYIQKATDGTIQVFQNAFHVIREFTQSGNITRLAGDGNEANPSPSVVANETSIRGTNSWSLTPNFYMDPATKDTYLAMQDAGVYKLTYSTKKWTRIMGTGSGSGTNPDVSDGVGGMSIRANGGNINILGIYDGKIYVSFQRQIGGPTAGTSADQKLIKTYDLASPYTQNHFIGVNTYETSGNTCSDGMAYSSCYFKPSISNGVPVYDSVGGRWYFPAGTEVYLRNSDGTFKKKTTPRNFNVSAYRRIPFVAPATEDTELLYYCSSGRLYKWNLNTNVETALPWISDTSFSCAGKTMLYDNSIGSLVFVYSKNGLNGVAEYYDP
ncbi:hypothetical protein B9G79_00335 [Bdellovibrio bacteriovorus]|uniref:Uncharacterized protein n=1 Tax=Bdellovibrio bacteriovorus TaxID=959 RepID=A0A1Z3N3R7_BDEBC|nr:hypothetical protein B9G79_00335 [Bdellovibrio bacteriovorus]